MKLLAEGRASEILDLGDGRVLRRFKSGGDPAREAEVMAHAAGHGYPVPRVDARSFARHVDVRSGLEEAAAFRLDDPNVSERERTAVRRLPASQYD